MKRERTKILALVIFFIIFTAVNAYAAVYKRGSRGEGVRRIQNTLLQEGLYTGNVDGIYGAQTEAAVREYACQVGYFVGGEDAVGALPVEGIADGSYCFVMNTGKVLFLSDGAWR